MLEMCSMALVCGTVCRYCIVSYCDVIPWCMLVISGVQIELNLVDLFLIAAVFFHCYIVNY